MKARTRSKVDSGRSSKDCNQFSVFISRSQMESQSPGNAPKDTSTRRIGCNPCWICPNRLLIEFVLSFPILRTPPVVTGLRKRQSHEFKPLKKLHATMHHGSCQDLRLCGTNVSLILN